MPIISDNYPMKGLFQCPRPDNRLFYDGDTYFGGNSMAGKLYNVTQVRPNNGKKYDTTSITRSIINFNFYNYEDLFTSFSPDFWLN